MNDELNRWLDGEITEEQLTDEIRDDAASWARLLATRREDVGPAPRWIEGRVMSALPARAPGRTTRALHALGWLTRPRTLRVRPVTVGALAAAALAGLLLLRPVATGSGPIAGPPPAVEGVRAAGTLDDGRVYVQFVYVAAGAEAVTVAGDFNGWSEEEFTLRDPDGDGVWSGYLPLSPGLHKYMFVVDGQWVTDPRAERHVDDGFGNRNALVSVPAPGSAI